MSDSPSFSWNNFDPSSLEAFARVFDYDGINEHSTRAAFLASKFEKPTLEFVERAFFVIQHSWLRRNENVAAGVVGAFLKNGIGPREKPNNHIERIRFLSQCSNRNVFRRYFQQALLKYGSSGKWMEESDFVLDTAIPRLSIIKPMEQSGEIREPYDYQQRAWDELNLNLAMAESSGIFDGLLVMPTGSGKTFTSVRWLMENHVNKGGRVLWLAHRHELLEQAAQAFATCAGLARDVDELRIRIVSGYHSPAASIGSDDNIICASVQSLARNTEIVSELLSDDRLFLVVDEAHHASAKSYKDIIEELRHRQRFKILGLTATPTRTLIHEQPILSRLFGNKRIFEVETRELIEKGYLSRPIPVTVKTDLEIEAGITAEDYEHLQSFNELSEAWKSRIANLTERNETITRHYLEHREKYGKTLVFAINIPHAELLCERLREAGVQTDYVASSRLNGESYNKRDIMDRFRDNQSGMDVLINVMILTEGVDIPNIKTVFLTRPVQSEILLRQMVGRALRGPSAGGTKEAYLVSFEDRWREFEEWERPLDLLQDFMKVQVEELSSEIDRVKDNSLIKSLAEVIPWDLIRRTAQEIRNLTKYSEISSFEAVPAGWYIIEKQDEDDLTQTLVPVYEHQRTCWNAVFDYLDNRTTNVSIPLATIREDYFFDCDTPRPASHDIDRVLSYTLREGRRPNFQSLSGREECDPTNIALKIWEDQLGPLEMDRLLVRRYDHPLSKAIFETFEEFRGIVQRELNNLTTLKSGRKSRLGVVEFEPWGNAQLSPGPCHDLKLILQQVLDHGKQFRDLHNLPWNGAIQWTRRPMKGWFGKAFWNNESPKGTGEIRINCLLDSPDIDLRTIEFLIWHEYLHLLLQDGHTPVFRRLEKKWPGIRDAERQLETLSERFDFLFFW
jgi:superfamily II DNA or RNA helicase